MPYLDLVEGLDDTVALLDLTTSRVEEQDHAVQGRSILAANLTRSFGPQTEPLSFVLRALCRALGFVARCRMANIFLRAE